MHTLNYHHLRYFWVIAKERSLTRSAERLHVSQSALSIQLKKLEESLGHPLFHRANRRLVLTEAGRMTLEYAETIFRTGDELINTLHERAPGRRVVLRVGSVSTLSRNFQLDLLRPLLGRADLELVIRSGSLKELIAQLHAHTIDLVLSNLPVRRDAEAGLYSHLLDEQPVSLVSRKHRNQKRFRFPEDLRLIPIMLPSLNSNIREAFDVLLDQAGVRPLIAAEIDDMAMLRLMARESDGVTLVPRVVVQGELRDGTLVERHRIRQIKESFYAITPSRQFPNRLVRELVLTAKKLATRAE